MVFPNPPPGWRRLQAMAQNAADSHTLSQIIAEMNRLVDQQEFFDEPREMESTG